MRFSKKNQILLKMFEKPKNDEIPEIRLVDVFKFATEGLSVCSTIEPIKLHKIKIPNIKIANFMLDNHLINVRIKIKSYVSLICVLSKELNLIRPDRAHDCNFFIAS